MEQLKTPIADGVLPDVNLYALAGTLQMRESCLAHQPVRNNASRDTHFSLVSLQIRRGRVLILVSQHGRRICPPKFARKRVQAQRLDLLQLLLTLFKLVARLKLQS